MPASAALLAAAARTRARARAVVRARARVGDSASSMLPMPRDQRYPPNQHYLVGGGELGVEVREHGSPHAPLGRRDPLGVVLLDPRILALVDL